MKILIITYNFYPKENPRSFRWLEIVAFWAQQGIYIDVVSASEYRSFKHLNLNRVNVYYVRDLFFKIMHLSSSNPFVNIFYKIIKKNTKILSFLIRWPDYAWLWIYPAYKKADKLMKNNCYDGIISVALPFSSHVVAMLLHKKHKKINWLCDYGDPFSVNNPIPQNNLFFYKFLNNNIEKKIMLSSKKITITTAILAEECCNVFGLKKTYFKVIPPLVKSDIQTKEKDLSEKQGHIHIVFVGRLYNKIRNPQFALYTLSKIKNYILPIKLKVSFYGEISGCESYFDKYIKEDWLKIEKFISQKDLIKVYNNSDIMLNIGNLSRNQIPSKIVEYMSLGKPILNIVFSENDLSIEFLKKYPSKFVLNEKDGINSKIINDISYFILNSKNVNSAIIADLIKEYQVDVVSKKYINHLLS